MSKRMGVQITLAAFTTLLLTIPSFADSQVRIVRLSSVQGQVQIDRATGQGFEKAFLNLPITQGGKIRTGEDGFAEVEFEDASTLRIAPGSVIEFPQLALEDSGAKLSAVNVVQGTAYVNFTGAKDSQLTLAFEREHVSLAKPTHLRLQVGHTKARVAVFSGDAQVGGPSGVVELTKKQSALFDYASQDQYTLAKNVEEGSYDAWDKQEDQYHQRDLQKTALNNSPYVYGTGDLNYYGSYYNLPGYGMMWQPYLTGAGWDPFMDGAWAFYPGMGYGWVSAYPWGWTPYHYGAWMSVPGYGWMWQPGGAWRGANYVPTTVNSPQGFIAPRPPTVVAPSLVVVNRGPINTFASSSNKVVVRSGSAGLGIPRGSIPNLAKFSQQVQIRGSATTTLHTAPAPMAINAAAANRASMGPANSRISNSGAAQSTASRSAAPAGTMHSGSPSFQPSGSPMGAGGVHNSAPSAGGSHH